MGFETILPFLRPLEALLADPGISEIMINPGSNIFIERSGRCERTDLALSETQIQTAAVMMARHLGEDISEDRPLFDARLPDGSRVAAAFPPCSIGGAALTIRKFQRHLLTVAELVRIGTLPDDTAAVLKDAVGRRRNILVSGGTGSGKTTLLNALAATVASDDRVVVIEDTAELQIDQPNQLRFEARRDQGNIAGVSIRDLLRATLRHRPDRIIVGEVRGPEAFDLLQALNTGHAGTLTTIHANSAALALNRLTTCVLIADVGLPFSAIRAQIADSIDLIIHIERRSDGKRVLTEVLELETYDFAKDRFELSEVYRHGGSHAIAAA